MSYAGFLTQSVRVAPRTSSTGDGQGAFGSARTYRARVEPYSKMVYGTDGALRQAHARIYLDAGASIDVDSDITLPDGSRPEIIEVHTIMDARSAHHIEVIV
jgi:hypothetical protein